MDNKVIGILAHVDAGKTTFSEQILYRAGVLRAPGRVDHQNAFLDAHPLERQRGITIFSDQAVFERGGSRYFWVDTPGHADFAAEMERAVSVLDYAVLIVSGADGVQSHTETIWALLRSYNVPAFIFVNKTDHPAFDHDRVMADIRRQLSADAVDLLGFRGGDLPGAVVEAAAERDENLLDRLMADNYDSEAWMDGLRGEIRRRELFPVYFGAALNGEGVAEFLDALCLLTVAPRPLDAPFCGQVYKIRHDAQGGRVCFFRVLSGSIGPRESLALPGGDHCKVNELRLYNGVRFQPVPHAEAGMLCAATGIPAVKPGDFIGAETGRRNLFRADPMMAASVTWNGAHTANQVLAALRTLEDEDPTLAVMYNERTGVIDLHVMGQIQLEVIRQLMLDRHGMGIDFGPMRVLYMETIASSAVGVGHYEPLRHYAEVQLRLVPGPNGSGVTFESLCHVDELALNWQRLIETHVFEKTHKGVLTGAPLTDVKVQLLHGRSHLKHTEGGDFRESTYRAIRNALMYAESVLLEPICRFTVQAPQDCYGRVMGDLTRMHARLDPPELMADAFRLSGEAAFALFSAYNTDFMAATHGRGLLSYRLDHYAPCRDAAAVIEAARYNPLADDTPDSVFCSYGAGFTVPWDQVREYAHCLVEA